ncbi:unnamed protein product [Arctogadus glacialis]
MSSANAEANLTTSTAINPDTADPFGRQTSRPTMGTTGLPTVVTVTSEEPPTGVQETQTQGPESPATTPGPATLQRSENHTEAVTSTTPGTSLDTTSHVPDAEASPTASYHTEALVRSTSARLESTEAAAAVVSEATTAYATPLLATTDTSPGLATTDTSPGLAAATTSGSQPLRSSEGFATSRSSAATPDTPTPTRPPSATVGGRRFSSTVLTTPPSPTSPPPSIEPDSGGVGSTRPAVIPAVTLTATPGAPGPRAFSVLWTALVVLLAVAVVVGALCLCSCVRRRRRRSRVLHFGRRGSGRNKGKEGDAWAGPVAISSMAATATAREEAGDEEEEEEKRKGGGGEEEVLLSTFGVDGTGRSSPNGRRGAGRAEEPPMLLFIDEDEVEVEARAGANNMEGGGGGGEVEEKGKEKEKDGKGLNGKEQTNGGTSFCYITAV